MTELEKIKQTAWSLENMKAHIGTTLPTRVVLVEHAKGIDFIYHQDTKGNYWYESRRNEYV